MTNDEYCPAIVPPGPDPRERFSGFQGMDLPALHRYVTGESTENEQRRIEAWAHESADRRRYLDVMRRLATRGRRNSTAAAAWRAIMTQMESAADADGPDYQPPWEAPAVQVAVGRRQRTRVLQGAFKSYRSRWALLFSTAAAVLIVTAGVRAAGSTTARAAAPAPPTMRVVTTTRGQQAEIRLDDGTRVVLGVDSRLRFAADFGTRARDVYLDGTAYFRVAHDSTKPFAVHTANAITQDVGTRFVVRSYPGDGRTAVVVTEGAVELRAPGAVSEKEAVLIRDQLGVLVDGRSVAVVSPVDPARYTAWMKGELVFRDTPLRDVVRELRRWYAVDVELGDSTLARMPFSASFAVETSRQAISTVTTVLPLRAVRRGNVVLLYRR
ncbi:MAG: FecR domain-containing protein [Gemmatimonadaceae bacterium]